METDEQAFATVRCLIVLRCIALDLTAVGVGDFHCSGICLSGCLCVHAQASKVTWSVPAYLILNLNYFGTVGGFDAIQTRLQQHGTRPVPVDMFHAFVRLLSRVRPLPQNGLLLCVRCCCCCCCCSCGDGEWRDRGCEKAPNQTRRC